DRGDGPERVGAPWLVVELLVARRDPDRAELVGDDLFPRLAGVGEVLLQPCLGERHAAERGEGVGELAGLATALRQHPRENALDDPVPSELDRELLLAIRERRGGTGTRAPARSHPG